MKIFLDMDQVLVDFYGGTKAVLGYDWETKTGDPIGEAGRNKQIVGPTFWQNLPPMPDYLHLIEFVRVYDPYILSATPCWEDPYVYIGKRAWIQQYVGIPQERVHIVHKSEKKNFAVHGNIPNLLIDDREDNVQHFIEAGGHGILHTSANNTIRELKIILNR
jgi:hypothetical protein